MSMHVRLLALTATAALSACSSEPVRIVVDPALADAETFEVSGADSRWWRTPVTFGAFSTRQMRVGMTHTRTQEQSFWGWTSEQFRVSEGVVEQPYRFVLSDEQGGEWRIECRANTPIRVFENDKRRYTRATGDTQLGCAARDPRGRVHGLEVSGNGRDYLGRSGFAEPPLAIVTLHNLAGRDGRAIHIPAVLGYELRQEGKVIAAMDNVDSHRIYFARTMPPELRPAAAATFVVLMFFGDD